MDTSLQNSASDNEAQDSSKPPVQTDSIAAVPRAVILPPSSTHKLVVELQEEEEDYGSGEEISLDSNLQLEVKKTPKKPAPQKDVGVTIEDPIRVNPSKGAKCPVSNLVYIRYLVRPFTQASLKSMLEKNFGAITELWLDRIKSSAIARFADQETAEPVKNLDELFRKTEAAPVIYWLPLSNEAVSLLVGFKLSNLSSLYRAY
ncbi:unnamed protein product [Rodentolepis nana]|uniref:RRM domain-containing protein n=1 Tax=Rodentolepis nana TaxID=102285 RepID=A0A0R3TKU9_RODNA|nr:unnamed protein product [Rodentolepis nana]